MKGLYKGFNKYISHIFVVKERKIEIGHPKDVKHVAHIGWDGGSATHPSWMNEFKTGPEFSAPSAAGASMPGAPLSPHGIDVPVPANGACKWPQNDGEMKGHKGQQGSPQEPKKVRRKKMKVTSPRGSSSSTRTHRERKSKSRFTKKAEQNAIVLC